MPEFELKLWAARLKRRGRRVEEKFRKYFGYFARCEDFFCTTTLLKKKSSQNQAKCKKNAVKISQLTSENHISKFEIGT